jgi:D-alanyl-D-alanine carboxypeptidase
MTSRSPILVVVFFLSLTSVWADEVDDLVQNEMRSRQIPGIALAVAKNGKEIKRVEYGIADIENNVPLQRDAVFEVGSVTMQFTATAVLILAQQNKLSLEDPITKYLPNAPETWKTINVRHLLDHSSGLKNYAGIPGFELTRRSPQATFVESIAALPPEFAPGEKAKYSVSNYALLGFIVENVSGKSFWVFLAENVFSPVGMTSSGDREPRVIIPNRVRGYEKTKTGAMINRDFDLTDMFAAGAMLTSIDDILKWEVALQSERVLTSSSKKQMWSPGTLKNGQKTSYGLGCQLGTLKGHAEIAQIGATAGFSASYLRYPETGLTVIVFANLSESGFATRLASNIAGHYLPAK